MVADGYLADAGSANFSNVLAEDGYLRFGLGEALGKHAVVRRRLACSSARPRLLGSWPAHRQRCNRSSTSREMARRSSIRPAGWAPGIGSKDTWLKTKC